MPIIGYNESSLGNSETYLNYKNTLVDGSAPEDPVAKATRLIKICKHLTKDDIDVPYRQLSKYSNTLSLSALKSFDDGNTILLYGAPVNSVMIPLIPYLTLRKDNSYKTYVFMDIHVRRSNQETEAINIQPGILHDLLVGAMIARGIKINPYNLINNTYLETSLMELYGSFVFRIINQLYMLGGDRINFEILLYYVHKFFLLNIFETIGGSEHVESLAKKHYKMIDPMKHTELQDAYESANPRNISELMSLLSTIKFDMENLNFKTFLNKWLMYYLPSSYLAIDNIEYLIFMILALKSNNNLISVNAIDIIRNYKQINQFDREVIKLIN